MGRNLRRVAVSLSLARVDRRDAGVVVGALRREAGDARRGVPRLEAAAGRVDPGVLSDRIDRRRGARVRRVGRRRGRDEERARVSARADGGRQREHAGPRAPRSPSRSKPRARSRSTSPATTCWPRCARRSATTAGSAAIRCWTTPSRCWPLPAHPPASRRRPGSGCSPRSARTAAGRSTSRTTPRTTTRTATAATRTSSTPTRTRPDTSCRRWAPSASRSILQANPFTFFDTLRDPDNGGWSYSGSFIATDANSTSLVLQAYAAERMHIPDGRPRGPARAAARDAARGRTAGTATRRGTRTSARRSRPSRPCC